MMRQGRRKEGDGNLPKLRIGHNKSIGGTNARHAMDLSLTSTQRADRQPSA